MINIRDRFFNYDEHIYKNQMTYYDFHDDVEYEAIAEALEEKYGLSKQLIDNIVKGNVPSELVDLLVRDYEQGVANRKTNYESNHNAPDSSSTESDSSSQNEQSRIEEFLKSDKVFTSHTPFFILTNDECIKASIDRDIDSVYYAGDVSLEIQNYAISKALEKDYVLHENSMEFLKRDYNVVKSSISLDVNSADYVFWPKLKSLISTEEINELMGILVEKGYVLHRGSHEYLCRFYEVVKNSISLNVQTADFVDWGGLSILNPKEDIDKLIDLLFEKGYVRSWRTSTFLLRNFKFVKYLIDQNVNMANYVGWDNLESSRSAEEMAELIDILKKKGYVLHKNSPDYLCRSYEVVKNSINKDVFSADYVKWDTTNRYNSAEEMDELIDILKKKGYVLHKNCPDYLCRSYEVVKNSISLDVNSADYVHWNIVSESNNLEKVNELIDLLVEKGYVLHEDSPEYLKDIVKVALGSIERDSNSYIFVSDNILGKTEIFRYLLSKGISLSDDYLRSRTLAQVSDKDILRHCFEQLEVYGAEKSSYSELYKDRFDELFSKIINTFPTIKTYESAFRTAAVAEWENYRRENINELENLFGKISSELRNNNSFNKSLSNLEFLNDMEQILNEQYYELLKAMLDYHRIYRSDVENKTEKMQNALDIISSCVALYCSKKRDKYVENEIEVCNRWLRQFFVLKLDNQTVDKKLVQRKKKEKFKELYQEKNEEVVSVVDGIINKYIKELDIETIICLIDGFVLKDKAKIEEIIPKPDNYDAYEKYEKAERLIKRLNLGYIKISGPEVESFRDIIGFDKEKGEYIYTGVAFSDSDISGYDEYKRVINIFSKIKRDLTLKIKEMDMELEITEEEKKKLAEELPFTDEYFEFNKSYLTRLTLSNFISSLIGHNYKFGFNPDSFENDAAYELINNILLNNGVAWLLLVMNFHRKYSIYNNGFCKSNICEIIDNASIISKMARKLKIDFNSLSRIFLVSDISKYADERAIDVLGLEIVDKLCRETRFTSRNPKLIVSRAQRLVAKMAGKSMSTVPYVSGEIMNYKYSLYDSQDAEVLLAGINTDACFRVDGNDNDFFHYCCLDKNGFVIKITDKDGNFIARAGGFRNGNCVFLNQLRTIYDECGDYYNGEYENEANEIIETLRKACEDIFKTSQENELEKDKIDYVFVTRSYSLKKLDSNVSDNIKKAIGVYPMETNSQDWKDFIMDNSKQIGINEKSRGFTTDYDSSYKLICLASRRNPLYIKKDDLKFGDVEALYERTRNKIIATTNIDSNIMRKIKKIAGIYSYFNDIEYKEISIPEGSTVFVGDNWYCIYADGQIVDSCVLDFDEKAKRDFILMCQRLGLEVKNLIQQQVENAQNMGNFQGENEVLSASEEDFNHGGLKLVM